MSWEQTTLPTTSEPGYGERALPAAELVKFDPRPTVVWFFDIEDDAANRSCETTVFQNERLALSLKRFRLVKIDVESITDAKMRREYARNTPAFHVIDPAGKTLASLAGKNATSLSRFNGMIKTSWGKLFSQSQGKFVKQMTKILDRLDRVTAQRTVLNAKKQRLEQRGQRGKLAKLAREEEELAEAEEKIEQDERKLIESCRLKKIYLDKDGEVAKAR